MKSMVKSSLKSVLQNAILLLLCVTTNQVFSQIYDPVKWSTSVEKISDTEYNLIATAQIEAEWHIYSQDVEPGGPIPTSFFFTKNDNFTLINLMMSSYLSPVLSAILDARVL